MRELVENPRKHPSMGRIVGGKKSLGAEMHKATVIGSAGSQRRFKKRLRLLDLHHADRTPGDFLNVKNASKRHKMGFPVKAPNSRKP